MYYLQVNTLKRSDNLIESLNWHVYRLQGDGGGKKVMHGTRVFRGLEKKFVSITKSISDVV